MALFKKRGSRLAVGLTAISLLALAGCSTTDAATPGSSTNSSDSASNAEVVTVQVMYASNEFTQDMIDAFEAENPDIKIEFIEYDQTRLNASLTAGDAPDIVRGSPSANLFARGLATPLDDYLASSTVLSADDLLPVNNLWRWDGSTRGSGSYYGIIKDWSADTAVWQNEELMRSAGVEPFSTTEPASWDEILDAAKALKKAGVEYPLGLEWQWGTTTIFQTMIVQQGGTFFNDDLSVVNFSTPEATRAMEWLVDYASSGVGVTSANPLADGWDGPTFIAGNMGMTMTGYWMAGSLAGDDAAAVRDGVSLIPTPTWGPAMSAVAGGVGAWIPAQSEHKDQAWRVMEFFMAGQPAVDRAASGWGLPVLKSLWDQLPTGLPFQAQAAETAKLDADAVISLPDSPYMDAAVFMGALDAAVMSVVNGDATVSSALATLQDEVNKALAQGKDQLG